MHSDTLGNEDLQATRRPRSREKDTRTGSPAPGHTPSASSHITLLRVGGGVTLLRPALVVTTPLRPGGTTRVPSNAVRYCERFRVHPTTCPPSGMCSKGISPKVWRQHDVVPALPATEHGEFRTLEVKPRFINLPPHECDPATDISTV